MGGGGKGATPRRDPEWLCFIPVCLELTVFTGGEAAGQGAGERMLFLSCAGDSSCSETKEHVVNAQ